MHRFNASVAVALSLALSFSHDMTIFLRNYTKSFFFYLTFPMIKFRGMDLTHEYNTSHLNLHHMIFTSITVHLYLYKLITLIHDNELHVLSYSFTFVKYIRHVINTDDNQGSLTETSHESFTDTSHVIFTHEFFHMYVFRSCQCLMSIIIFHVLTSSHCVYLSSLKMHLCTIFTRSHLTNIITCGKHIWLIICFQAI